MKRIGLAVKDDPEAKRQAKALEKWFQTRGIVVVRKTRKGSALSKAAGESAAPPDLFCTVALGGDGTFLSAVRWIGDNDIPIHGVKFGDVGFLAESSEDNLFGVAEAILRNEFTISARMRLRVDIIRDGRKTVQATVLNDVVVNKGTPARLVDIETYIDDHYLTTYRADGLIISTPTGSTAYSLAAGGPILHPEVPGIIMTPICPFTLTNRPLIVPDTVCIKIRLQKHFADTRLTFDGQTGHDIDIGDTIIIQKGAHPIRIIKIPGPHYFDVLKTKLRWSGSRV